MTRKDRPAQRRLTALPTDRVVVCDGAMGTMLHAAGIPLDRSLSELNVTRPELVRDLHAAYLAAGADVLQTNTFDANRLRLARDGQQDRVTEINIAGARLAREAVQDGGRRALVAGSVGPAVGATLVARLPRADRAAVLREQIAALADWVDVIMLETFDEIDSLGQAVEVALDECDLPVVAQMTFGDDGRTLRGEDPRAVAEALTGLGIAALGANCTVGPAVLQDVIAVLAAHCTLPVIVQPNAGTPRRFGRRLHYAHNTEYFAEAATRLVAAGASLVGGCCGTTPGHVRAISKAVAGLAPAHREPGSAEPAVPARAERVTIERTPAGWPELGRPVVVAALRPPGGPDVPGFVERARELTSAGADLLAIIDPEPSANRVNPVGAAVLLSERVGAPVMVQIETAGRSLPALQADLLGAHAFGLHTVVCRTGSPRVAGDYPELAAASDIDSIRLIAALAGLNEGVDWRGVAIPERTRFVIGASLCTAATDRRRELGRAVEKVRAGAHFLLTDVIYDVSTVQEVLAELRAQGVGVPVVAAVAPFRDARTIARLTHEIPEVAIPVDLPGTLADDRGDRPQLALEIVEKLGDGIAGVLVHTPCDPESRAVTVVAALRRACRAS